VAPYVVTMPQLGESVSEGTINRWLVKPGDHIAEFDAMVEITTDKVDAEVPSPVTGTLTEILAEDGAVVPVGEGIAIMDIDDGGTEAPAKAAPAVSDEVNGAAPAEVSPHDVATPRGGDESIALTPVRRQIAETMSRAKATIPHAWQAQEVDMSGVRESIAAHREATLRDHGARLTYVPYVVAAAARSLHRNRIVNASFEGDRVVLHHDVNIGVAVALDDGVIVPVVKDAGSLGIAGLAAAIDDLVTRARDHRLSAADVAGGTFTVNNSGALGTLFSYSVITPGQAGVLTMGAVVERPVAVNQKIEVRPMMYLCFSLDHRVMDGLQASEFLRDCKQWLEGITVATPLS
jgi:2-oxoisovalerate dehydrogenase E2 component (dihydrolipoyl transacylase)